MTSAEMPPLGDQVDAAARDDLRGLFELEAVHRRGPAALVCIARDLEFDQPVALKVMPRAPGAGAEAEEAFHRAAALVAGVEHPHVVPLYSAGVTDRFFWCSMEYVEGRSLGDLLRSSAPMDPSTTLRLVGQVATALDAAHRLGVVHAGLTPGNVLIDAAGDAHVTDFWIPWVLERLGAFPGDGGKARRAKYRAPEQVSEDRCGPEADQYALAALMQACLIKTPARVPPDVGRAIERALNPTPEARFPSVRDFLAALGAAGARPPSGALPRLLGYDARDYAGSAPRPSKWRWVPVSVLTLVVLGAIAAPWLLSSGSAGGGGGGGGGGGDQPLGDGGAYPTAAADSAAALAPTPDMRLDTVTLEPPAPVVTAPSASSAAPAPTRRPRAVSRAPERGRPLPGAATPPGTPAPARLFINATPWGQVYIDGELLGNTPRVDVPVSPGRHQLRVVRDGFQPYEAFIQVTPGQELRMTDIWLEELKP